MIPSNSRFVDAGILSVSIDLAASQFSPCSSVRWHSSTDVNFIGAMDALAVYLCPNR